jgi:hypothetical protein
MNEIKCPKCGNVFKVDEAGYADIIKQVRDHEFAKELHDREELLRADKENAVKLVEEQTKNAVKDDLAKKEAEVASLKADKDLALARLESQKDAELANLRAQIQSIDTEKKLALNEAVNKVEKERDELKIKLANQENEKELIKKGYETQIRDRDDAIERLKDMKAKLSTKMIGESLEQHCQNEFNKIRATAFPVAYFEKDNDASSGSKGDYVFRDPADGVESVSIMFDMKNENDATETKKKNEDFLAKLDRDRNEKGCEYAILVSMLEADSDLYNQGIVDVSYKYPKMYVIRPQFFVPMITLLKNAAEKSLAVKNELAIIKSQNIDITTFENDVNGWKAGWLTSMKNAGKKHVEAVEQINKAIKDLEKVRDALTMSDKHLLAAENKMDDLTIKRLTRKNPTMAAKFAELEEN